MSCHNSRNYVSCESEFDSVSLPLAKKMDATDVYVIESDKQEASERTVTVIRLCGISEESWDYTGVFYTNCFRASKPITLTSVGFFGPALPEGFEGPVAYVVDIQIEELRKASSSSYGKFMRFTVKVSRTEAIFYVNFQVPINILANVWYNIKFRLEGPDTFRGMEQLDRVFSTDGVTFDFFQGSLQMPHLKYSKRRW